MTSDTHTAAQAATRQLGGKWHSTYGMARCPAHDDKNPSLSIQAGEKAVLYHCFAGCSQEAIMDALKGAGIEPARARRKDSAPMHLRKPMDMQRLALEIWDKAKNVRGTPAQVYLDRRGIYGNSHARFDPRSRTNERINGVRQTLTLPALVLPIHDHNGFVGIQRVFLTKEGEKADISSPKKILGNIGRGAIRLGAKPTDTLNLAEGFEDAQSAIQLRGLTHCWAVFGIGRYKTVAVPDGIKKVVIYSQHGNEARDAIEDARAHLCDKRRTLDIVLPPGKGDWNDLVRETAQVD